MVRSEFDACSLCGSQVTLAHKDSVNTQFYKCPTHGFITAITHKKLNDEQKKLSLAFEIQAEQNGQKWIDPLNPMSGFCDDKGTFKPALVSMFLKANEKFKTDRKNDVLYFYNGKAWVKDAEPYLKELTANLLGEDTRESHYNNILFHLKATTLETVTFSNKIACENGLLDPQTGEFTDFNSEEMPFHEIPVTYNKDVDKSKLANYLEFLNQVANPDDIPLLQEWFGYCFLADYRFHKALWIHGEGRNGKGVFDRTIKGILGLKNVSTVGLEQLDGKERFVLKNLYGKLYNSSSEPTSNKIFQTEIFQKVTGSDLIHAELKNANQEIEFINTAKMTIIGNKFPKINSPTIAFKDRMIFVKFPNHFDDKAQIQNLEYVWLNDPEQKTAILNWALEGLQRLLSQGHFSLTKTQQEIEIEFNRVSDSITAFKMEQCIISKNLTTTRANALLAYQEYCEAIGVEPRKPSQFTQGMLCLAPKVKDGWIYLPKKERAWLGLGLKPKDNSVMEQMEQQEQQIIPEYISNLKNKKNKTGVPSVPSVLFHPTNNNPAKEQLIEPYNKRVCGDCAKFHKESCEFPNGEFLKVQADWWAGEMQCFLLPQPEMIGYEFEEASI